MLKLKLQYFGHLMQRANSLEKTVMLGKIEGGRRRGQQWMRWLDGITDSVNMSEFEQTLGDSEGQGSLACCSSWGCKESYTTEWLNKNKISERWISHTKEFQIIHLNQPDVQGHHQQWYVILRACTLDVIVLTMPFHLYGLPPKTQTTFVSFFGGEAWDLQDLSSPARDLSRAPCSGSRES